MKHTHTGHCQACGRVQAIRVPGPNRTGALAKHGYRVKDFGYFVGTCPGSDHLPLEQDRQLSDKVIADMRVMEQAHLRAISEYRDGRRIPDRIFDRTVWNRETRKHDEVWIDWAAGSEYERQAEVNRRIREHEWQASQAKSHGDSLTRLIARVHGKPLTPVKRAAEIVLTAGMDLGDFILVNPYAQGGGFRQAPTYHVKRKSDDKVFWFPRIRINAIVRSIQAGAKS